MDNKSIDMLSTNLISLTIKINEKVLKHDELIKSFNIPPSNAKVMVYLFRNGPSSASKISKDLMISKPNMTPIIDRLLDEGFIEKYNDPSDRRVTILKCTEMGKDYLLGHYQKIKNIAGKKLSVLSDNDIELLNGLSSEFLSILSKLK